MMKKTAGWKSKKKSHRKNKYLVFVVLYFSIANIMYADLKECQYIGKKNKLQSLGGGVLSIALNRMLLSGKHL